MANKSVPTAIISGVTRDMRIGVGEEGDAFVKIAITDESTASDMLYGYLSFHNATRFASVISRMVETNRPALEKMKAEEIAAKLGAGGG